MRYMYVGSFAGQTHLGGVSLKPMDSFPCQLQECKRLQSDVVFSY